MKTTNFAASVIAASLISAAVSSYVTMHVAIPKFDAFKEAPALTKSDYSITDVINIDPTVKLTDKRISKQSNIVDEYMNYFNVNSRQIAKNEAQMLQALNIDEAIPHSINYANSVSKGTYNNKTLYFADINILSIVKQRDGLLITSDAVYQGGGVNNNLQFTFYMSDKYYNITKYYKVGQTDLDLVCNQKGKTLECMPKYSYMQAMQPKFIKNLNLMFAGKESNIPDFIKQTLIDLSNDKVQTQDYIDHNPDIALCGNQETILGVDEDCAIGDNFILVNPKYDK